ncbi:hypothetical protein [Streptomyces sp. NPDC059071]|uniref:hypothetical protein n=1 Tax=unclassified Streptomyces TaxID=2593676 RepID=UPI0036429A3D
MRTAVRTVEIHGRRDTVAQARALAEDLARGDTEPGGVVDPTDRDAVVRAATVEALSGPWHAPVRFLGRHRTAAWAVSFGLCLVVDRRFAAVRKDAEARHVAALEASFPSAGDHGGEPGR